MYSALKLEKKFQFQKYKKHIICIFKNGKKSVFALEKSPKIAFLLVLNFFLVQKVNFCAFEIVLFSILALCLLQKIIKIGTFTRTFTFIILFATKKKHVKIKKEKER